MSAQELLSEIRKLPVAEQKQLLETRARNLSEQTQTSEFVSEDQVQRILFEEGIIGNIPDPSAYPTQMKTKAFEPVKITGKPLSETIIEERR